jgi:hypothetical protein
LTPLLALVLTSSLVAATGSLASVPRAAASSGTGDRSRITALERRIAADGASAKRVVTRYDDAAAKEAMI